MAVSYKLLYLTLLFLVLTQISARQKLVARAKVKGQGYSAPASSASHCLALCEKDTDCDGVNFQSNFQDGRCRLLKLCAATTVKQTSDEYYYYSRRPQVLSDGYVFENKSESCLKVLREQTDYAIADHTCQMENGRLVVLGDQYMNDLAATLLQASGAQFAWIGLRDIGAEGNPTHNEGTSAAGRGFFLPSPQYWRNDSTRNCWALQDDSSWVELSCKNRKLYSLCEIPLF